MAKDKLKLNAANVLETAATTRKSAQALSKNADFKNLELTPDIFGGFPSAGPLVQMHKSAHTVVSKTLDDVTVQLEDFALALEASVSTLTDAETDSRVALDAIALENLSQVQAGDLGDSARVEGQAEAAPDERYTGREGTPTTGDGTTEES